MEKDFGRAVDAYVKVRGFFNKHRSVPSFRGIDKECTDLINDVAKEVESQLLSAVSLIACSNVLSLYYIQIIVIQSDYMLRQLHLYHSYLSFR